MKQKQTNKKRPKMKMRLIAICMIFTYFLCINPVMAVLKPPLSDDTKQECTYTESSVSGDVIVMKLKVIPFIDNFDVRILLIREKTLSKKVEVTYYKNHLNNYLYEISGGALPVKV